MVALTGVIGLIDSLSHAYPSFILSEDVGHVEVRQDCPCGRNGQVVVFVSERDGAPALWRMDIDGGRQQRQPEASDRQRAPEGRPGAEAQRQATGEGPQSVTASD